MNNIPYNYTCGYCHHKAQRHYASIVSLDESAICLDCITDAQAKDLNNWHQFKIDNLTHIEELAKAKGLV